VWPVPIALSHSSSSVVEGDKRAAFAAIIVLLGLNGIDFDVPPAAAAAMILGARGGRDRRGRPRTMDGGQYLAAIWPVAAAGATYLGRIRRASP
jgi:hypothetical protein